MTVTLPRFSATRSALCATALSLFLLVGCGEKPSPVTVQTQVAEITVPAAQQSCPGLPTAPDPDDPRTTQRDVALYITELVAVAEHCRDDLVTINRIIADFNERARKTQEGNQNG